MAVNCSSASAEKRSSRRKLKIRATGKRAKDHVVNTASKAYRCHALICLIYLRTKIMLRCDGFEINDTKCAPY